MTALAGWIKGEWTDDLLFGLLADRWRQLAAGASGFRFIITSGSRL
jgi:hypothetical protein